MKRVCLLGAVASALLACVAEAGTWSCLAIKSSSEISLMHSSTNVLAYLYPYCFTNNNKNVSVSTAAPLVDGAAYYKTSSATYTLSINKNSSIYWDLSSKFEEGYNGVDLSTIRICSSWGDTGRCQIKIASIQVRTVESGESWVALDNSAYASDGKNPTYMATFFNEDGSLLAENVTHLMIDFGPSQQNGFVGYSEIEASVKLHGTPTADLVVNWHEEFGTVQLSPQAEENKYPLNSDVTLTATPADGFEFARWFGDVPDDQIYNPIITINMDDPKNVTAVYTKDWEYSDKIMTDGYFKVTTSVNGTDVTITKVEQLVTPAPVFDLRKPVNGMSGNFVKINDSVFNGIAIHLLRFADSITHIGDSCRNMNSLKEVVLPANLTYLGHCAFYSCRALTKVTPLLPYYLTNLGGEQQFQGCPITGKLVAGPFLPKIGEAMLHGTAIEEMDFRESVVTSIEASALRDNSKLKVVYLPATVESVGDDFIYGCSASLRSIYFEAKPETFSHKAFEGVSANMRIVVYKSDAEWMDYFSECEALESPTFIAWENVSAADKNSYAATFSDECEPYGRTKIGSNGGWMFVATRRGPGRGLLMIVR